jgi:hypothetical protein
LTTVDVPSTEIVINQTAFYLALLISIGSVIGIAYQAFRAIGKRFTRAREAYEAKLDGKYEIARERFVTQLTSIEKEIVDLKARTDYLNNKIINGFFNQKGKDTEQHLSDIPSSNSDAEPTTNLHESS